MMRYAALLFLSAILCLLGKVNPQEIGSDYVNILTPYSQNDNSTIVQNNKINKYWETYNIPCDACHGPDTAVENSLKDSRTFYIQNSNPILDNSLIIKQISVNNHGNEFISPQVIPFFNGFPVNIGLNQTIAFNITYNCHNDMIISQDLNGWTYLTVTIETLNKNITYDFLKICTLQNKSRYDLSLVIILVIAAVIVGFASRQSKTLLGEQGNHEDEITPIHAVLFIIMGSCALVTFYFLLEYIENVLTIMISISSISSLTIMINDLLDHISTSKCLMLKNSCNMPYCGLVSWANVLSLLGALTIVISWFFTRNWILNNMIGLCIVCLVFKAIKIPSLEVATILLGLAFFYDIFWVFLSKPIFGESVMAVVASSLDLPMKIELPLFQDSPIPRCTMLGLGDMVLPGLFISFTFKFDQQKSINSYYKANLIGYIMGLILCGGFLILMNMAQPALLYIVPCMLSSVFFVGFKRKEVKELWKGLKTDSEHPNDLSNLMRGKPRSDSIVHLDADEEIFEMRRRDIREI